MTKHKHLHPHTPDGEPLSSPCLLSVSVRPHVRPRKPGTGKTQLVPMIKLLGALLALITTLVGSAVTAVFVVSQALLDALTQALDALNSGPL